MTLNWPLPQPIETAPKDESIMLYRPYRGWELGNWDDDRFAKKPRPYWRSFHGRRILRDRGNPPTHWLPRIPNAEALLKNNGVAHWDSADYADAVEKVRLEQEQEEGSR